MQAPFFIFCHLHRLCKRHFLHFVICIGYASIKTFIFTFAERRCVFGMVGAVPVCPPERLRSGVSIPKYICTSRIMHEDLTMDAPLQGDTVGHTGTDPTHLHHAFPCNPPIINGHICHVPTKPSIIWNGRGGACVPARTFAQRRLHTKIYLRITHHARGFNDGCALAGRHGRAHRHRPYQTP